jgi:hypothetical protein
MKKNILIFFTIVVFASCTSGPPPSPERESWEVIIDSIPWENRIIGDVTNSIIDDVPISMLTIPNELSNIMYDNGYLYVNSTYLKNDIDEHVYELKKENATYYPDDDTFAFAGEFYPDGSSIWLVFSTDKDYALYMGPEDINNGQYNLSRTTLKPSSAS